MSAASPVPMVRVSRSTGAPKNNDLAKLCKPASLMDLSDQVKTTAGLDGGNLTRIRAFFS
jgi:hypothetical protein